MIKDDFPPDIIILNLGINDNENTLIRNFPYFSNYAAKHKTKVLFSPEPGIDYLELSKVHMYIPKAAKAAQELGFTILPNYRLLKDQTEKESGQIWVDEVHFSDFGHLLSSKIYIKEILEVISSDSE